jgi:hypothetical protein
MKKIFYSGLIVILMTIFSNYGLAQMTGRDIMLKVDKQQEVKTRARQIEDDFGQ